MDSTSLLMRLLAERCRVFALSFDYGQKHQLELERLAKNLAYLDSQGHPIEHHTISVPQLGELFHSALTNADWDVPAGHYQQENMKATVVPNRNAIFASIAYGYALSLAGRHDAQAGLCLGVHSGDHEIYPDCRPEFYQALNRAFQIGNWDSHRVTLWLPYLEIDKLGILQDASRCIDLLGLDFDTVFANTCTSYQPDAEGRSTGLTGSDVERILAFHEFGRPDPVTYQQPWSDVVATALEMEREFRKSAQRS